MIVLPHANATGGKNASNTNTMEGWATHQSVVPRSIPIALDIMSGGDKTVGHRQPNQSCESNLLGVMCLR